MGISASELKLQSRKPIGASNDRLEPHMQANPPRLLPGGLENGYERDEAAERYDRPEALGQNGERRATALAVDPWNFARSKAYLFMG